ncbi:MAG TPA: GMC oxidoreductase [Chitinophagales bacterium]|nr:GMC oxidoreductase [Chitinophagales bacterium]
MNSEQSPADFIVVGSGLTGAMAAQTLVEKDAQVLMLDVAYRNEVEPAFPLKNFLNIRQENTNQRELMLGENFEGIPWGLIKTGAQLTPGRKYLIRGLEQFLSMASNTFFPMESLAYGGLGNAWGAGCYIFSNAEFEQMGIKKSLFEKSYQVVGDRIGISAGIDDALKYTVQGLNNILPALQPEESVQQVIDKYKQKKDGVNSKGFYAGIPAVAILTKDKDKRKAFSYNDMDFWHDQEQSVYRPWMTVDQLKRSTNFQLKEKQLVLKYEEINGLVKVTSKNVETNEEEIAWCRKLVLCSGVLGTARIVLRSAESDAKLPLLCNPYAYVPMLSWKRLGKVQTAKRNGMGQLVMFYDKKKDNSDVPIAALFTYRSLLLFRLIKESPLNFADGRALMQYLAPAMVISGIHHPEKYGDRKFLQLQNDSASITGDKLFVEYILSKEEEQTVTSNEKDFFRTFRSLGLLPVSKVYPGHGSSIHYAGTLPVSGAEDKFTTAENGRLHETKNVFVADGSCFKFLPAKGISFTLMANAERVANEALKTT